MPLSESIHPDLLRSPVMDGISWETYEAMCRESDQAGNHFHITYDRGRMLVMSPLAIHEKWKQLIGRLIETLAEERQIPLSAFGSATWRREDVQRGLEADQYYYLQNAMRLRGKNEIDLSSNPPPDLAIEFEVSPAPLNRMSIYAALRVPEVWRYDGAHIKVFCLEDEAYAERASSVAFDGFRPDELQQFLALYPSMLDGEIVRAFRAWLRASHKP